MTTKFDPNKIRNASRSLSDWKRLAFMAACCERMLTNYASFSVDSGSGDVSVLRQALDLIWQSIETGRIAETVDDLVAACDFLAPNTSEFDSAYTSAALDAANAIAITLEALSDASEDRVVEVATLARDTVDVFVQQQKNYDQNAMDLESLILSDPLMQKELVRQNEIMEFLKGGVDHRHDVVRNLRSKWSAIDNGSLPISICQVE